MTQTQREHLAALARLDQCEAEWRDFEAAVVENPGLFDYQRGERLLCEIDNLKAAVRRFRRAARGECNGK